MHDTKPGKVLTQNERLDPKKRREHRNRRMSCTVACVTGKMKEESILSIVTKAVEHRANTLQPLYFFLKSL